MSIFVKDFKANSSGYVYLLSSLDEDTYRPGGHMVFDPSPFVVVAPLCTKLGR